MEICKSAVQKSFFSSLARLLIKSKFRIPNKSDFRKSESATQIWSIPTSGSGIKILIPTTLKNKATDDRVVIRWTVRSRVSLGGGRGGVSGQHVEWELGRKDATN